MNSPRRWIGRVAAPILRNRSRRALALSIGLAASGAICLGAASFGNASAAAGPITIGAISTTSGPVVLPGFVQGAQAYYKWVNAHGGINGRQIKYIVTDDAGNPTTTAQLARQLINQDGAVMLSGGDSSNDCSVNGGFYQQSNIVDVSVSTDTTCYTQSNIGNVIPPPAAFQTGMLYYASNVAHYKRICLMGFNLPSQIPNEEKAVAAWEKVTGKTLALSVLSLDPAADPLPGIIQMKNANCQVVVSPGLLSSGAALVKEALSQGMTKTLWMLGPFVYDPAFIKAAGPAASLGIDTSDVAPWSDSSQRGIADAVKVLKAAAVPVIGSAVDGYTTAWVTVKVLKSIKGPITKQSVTAAFKALKTPITVPTMSQKYSFGPGSAHINPSPGFWFIGSSHGKWKILTKNAVVLPAATKGL